MQSEAREPVMVRFSDPLNRGRIRAEIFDPRIEGIPWNPIIHRYLWVFSLDKPLRQESLEAIGETRAAIFSAVRDRLRSRVSVVYYTGQSMLELALRGSDW